MSDGIWNWLNDEHLHIEITKKHDSYIAYISAKCGEPTWVYQGENIYLTNGKGNTIEEAIADMITKYNGHKLVIFFDDEPAQYYNFPILINI